MRPRAECLQSGKLGAATKISDTIMLISIKASHGFWLTLASVALPVMMPGFLYAQEAAEAVSQQDGRAAQAQAIVQEYVDKSKVPGVAVTIALGQDVVWSVGLGFADTENSVVVVPGETLFRVGSTAKPMTATAIGLLYEQGKLDLDAPVQKYVRSFPAKEGKITTRLLAGHLAGIRHYKGNEFYSDTHYPDVISGLSIFEDDPLLFKPGTKYSFSSYGYSLIAAVIEGASGTDFLTYMQQDVFDAIGMSNTLPDDVTKIIGNRSAYYEARMFRIRKAPDVDNSYQWAGGGFLSTSEDMVKFGQAWLDASILQPETVELFWTSQKTAKGKDIEYGIGWRLSEDKTERRWVWHDGDSVGGTTWFGIQPESGFVIAIITNVTDADFDDIHTDLADIFLQ